MKDTERSREDLQLELAEHYRRIREIEAGLHEQGTAGSGEPMEWLADLPETDDERMLWASIVDTIPSAVAIVRSDGSVAMVNRRWQEIYGYGPDNVILDDHIARMKPCHPDGTPISYQDMPGVRALRHGEMTRNREMIIHPGDGDELPVLVSAAPLFNEHGQITAAVIVFDDIVDFKKMQSNLAESERDLARQTFLLALAEAMRPLEDAVEIQNLVTGMLGEHLGVERALYGEMEDKSLFVVKRDFRVPGLKSFAGHYALDLASPVLVSQLRAGKTNVVQNVFEEFVLTDSERRIYEARELTAFIMVPLVKAGHMVAFLRVQCSEPHAWTDSDVALVEEVAERTWAAVERARAEEALRTSEQTHRSILDNLQDGIVLFDLGTMRFRYISQSQADRTGFTLDELYGLSYEEFQERLHPDDRTIFAKQLEPSEANLAASDEVEYQWMVKNGEYHWFRDRRKYILNEQGQPVAIVVSSRDVTQLKENERRVAFQAHLLEKVHDAIIATDQNYRITYWNESAEQIFRWPAKDAVGSRLLSLMRTLEPEAASDRSIVSMIRQDNFSGEVPYQRRNEETLYLDVQTNVIRDAQGHLEETISSIRDITIRKQAELRLKESEQRATALVEQLRRYDKNRNDFLNALSHELRNPLAAIVSSLDLLTLTVQGVPAVNRVISVLKRQTRHLTRLVDDLLDVTRIMNNKIRLRKEAIDLIELLNCALSDICPQFQAKDVKLLADLPAGPMQIMADSQRLSQVVSNLLHNALKFTKPGGVVRLDLARDTAAHEVRISISDTGEGIAPEMLAHIFEPFSQAEQTLARSQGGLGLGLSIVRGMVEMHGGTVQAFSEGQGKGSTFVIHLPV